jgi:predicted ATP-binding protein involved in virulence
LAIDFFQISGDIGNRGIYSLESNEMRFQKAVISNYKGIEHLEISFNEGINLFIGNNGAGKTSLLDSLSVIISQALSLLAVNAHQHIETQDVRTTTALIGDVTANTIHHYPVELDADIWFRNDSLHLSIKKAGESLPDLMNDFSLSLGFNSLFEKAEVDQIIPLLCYQRAGRGVVIKENNANATLVTTKRPERIEGYNNAFSRTFDIEAVQKWCLQMELTEYQKKREIKEYSEFRNIVSLFMSKLEGNEKKYSVHYDFEQGTLVYSDGKELQPVYHLSAGYQSVLCLIMELAYRSVLLNPSLEHVAENITGIVMVDEIEIHLHPKWQWKILNALHETFPNVQLIVASHSPIILSSVKDASLYLMKSPNEVISLENAYGYTVNDVLDFRLGSSDSPEEVKAYFNELDLLTDVQDKEGIESLLCKAESQFGRDSDLFKRIKEYASIFFLIEDE